MKLIKMAGMAGLFALATVFGVGALAAQARVQAPSVAPTSTRQPGTHVLDAEDLSAWLDGRVPYALESGDIAGAVVVVVKDGKVLFKKGYGYADVAAKVPMDADKSMVRIGSTSKLFTWTAVMQLVQQGKIDLDRNVNDYLDFKIPEPYGKPVTMRMLMNHRAGFEEGLKDLLAYDPAQFQSNEEYLKKHPRPMLFPPGKVPAYSNYGAALAGYIVQRVSGEPYEVYIGRHLFQPLGMLHSTMVQPLPDKFKSFAAKGYHTASDETASPFELVTTSPAGSASATGADMARFMLAHLQQGSLDGHAILDPATTALMHHPSETGLPGFATMAHGFFHDTRNGQTVIGHGGDTVVFHTELDLLPNRGVGIFYSFNSRGKDTAVYVARQQIFDGFMDRYFPKSPGSDPETLASATSDAQQMAGRYESSRRIEHGFLSALYVLSQTVITANVDGTITVPNQLGEVTTYREIAPRRWREVGGTHELALSDVDGVKTVSDSENPVAVLQQASFLHSAPLNLTVLAFSLVILLCTLLLWPLAAVLRRADRAVSGMSTHVRRLRLYQRLAVVFDVIYLFAWFELIKPVLSTDLAIYNTAHDWLVRSLQVSGLLAILAALVGVWAAWRMFFVDASWLSRTWSVLVALALLGVVWVAWIGQLLSWNLNY